MAKNPRDDQSFQEPVARAAQQQAAEADEEARIESFDAPLTADTYSEDVASIQAESTPAGIPRNLLEIKTQIESMLNQNASGTAVQSQDAFQGAPNIQGVGIGLGETDAHPGTPVLSTGISPGEPALNIYVAELTSIDEVKSVVVEAAGAAAASSDAIPMNIIQTGIIEAQPQTFRARPAPGGVSVAHFKVTAGTIGCFCIGNSAPRNSRLMVLSNNHVLANVNAGAYGDCVCQPGPYDGGKCPADQIAILERFVPINFAAGASNVVDCATAWCWPDRVRRDLVARTGGGLSYFRIGSAPIAPTLGMLVGKSGRTTQCTTGRVTGIGVTINVNYGGGRVGHFVDQISIQSITTTPFSAGGDSGSSIWTWNSARSPVALLFAGGGGVTFANRMTRVIQALDVHLAT